MTKQVDIDIYYDLGGKMEVKNIDDEDGIILKIPRMKKKKPELVDFDKKLSGTVQSRFNDKLRFIAHTYAHH